MNTERKFVYRVIGKNEDATCGIFAKNPSATISITDFIHSANRGGKAANSQFVALSASFRSAIHYAMMDHCALAIINWPALTEAVKPSLIFDVSTLEKALDAMEMWPSDTGKHKAGFYRIAAQYAAASAEIDIMPGKNGIARSVYKLVSYEQLLVAYRICFNETDGDSVNYHRLFDYLQR